jgi:choice-of-anchor A domain-containing protein
MKSYWPGLAIGLGLLIAPTAFATPYDTLQSIAGTYNMFLLGNLGSAVSPYNADMQGAVAVGGNAYLSNVGVDTTGASPGLVVGGNLSQTGGTDYGNVFVGGNANLAGGATIPGSISMTGANATLTANGGSSPAAIYVTASASVNDPAYWAKPTVGTPTSPLDFFGSSTDIKNASTSLAGAGTSTVTSSGGAITITLTKSGLNVINLSIPSGTTISGITIVNANGVVPTGLVINVSGDNIAFNGGSFNLGSLSTSQVLFNFPTATAISLNSVGFQGDILAPLAQVSFNNGQIQGDLIAGSFMGSGQINLGSGPALLLPTYTTGGSGGTTPTVPEPGSLVLVGTGLLAIAFYRRRASRLAMRS